MRSCQAGGVAGRRGRTERGSRIPGPRRRVVTVGAIVAAALALGAPAHAASSEEPGGGFASEQATLVDLADDRAAVLLQQGSERGRLPFAPPDLFALVLGGVAVMVAAAGAPLLLRPRRPSGPWAAARAGTEPLPPAAVQGAGAHAAA